MDEALYLEQWDYGTKSGRRGEEKYRLLSAHVHLV